MRTKPTESAQRRLHVFHPVNTAGTTWLRQSGLVFKNKRPYAVLNGRDEPEVLIELNRKLLSHDRPGDTVYRYEGEILDPRKR
jgi:hypothetical protein